MKAQGRIEILTVVQALAEIRAFQGSICVMMDYTTFALDREEEITSKQTCTLSKQAAVRFIRDAHKYKGDHLGVKLTYCDGYDLLLLG